MRLRTIPTCISMAVIAISVTGSPQRRRLRQLRGTAQRLPSGALECPVSRTGFDGDPDLFPI